MSQPNRSDENLDGGLLVGGFILGLLIGSLLALFKAPKNLQNLRQQLSSTTNNLLSKVEASVSSDPIAESLAEGKAAARRRRAELGLKD
jgi:gas vesicle protein